MEKEAQRDYMVAALLLVLRDATYIPPKGRTESAASHILRNALKWSGSSIERVDALHSWGPKIGAVLESKVARILL